MKQAALIAAAVLVAAVLGALWEHGRAADQAAQDRIELLAHHVKTVDSIYTTDTLYFQRTLKVERAVHDTVLLHLTDTVWVKRYIAAADTAISACTEALHSCELRVAQRDSIIALYKAMKPSRISLGVQATCGVGLAARADCVVGAGVSWRVF